jgi:hypothetical protein
VQRILLSDGELLRAIAENADGMSALVHEQVELEASIGEWDDPENPKHTNAVQRPTNR